MLRFLAVLCNVAGAVIGFIDGFSGDPAVSYPWAVPITVALIASGVALWLFSHELEGGG
jgi:hypothetical protein